MTSSPRPVRDYRDLVIEGLAADELAFRVALDDARATGKAFQELAHAAFDEICRLTGLVRHQSGTVAALHEENRALRDELERYTGSQVDGSGRAA